MPPGSQSESRGLGYWMHQVIKESAKAQQGLASDPVHDLRVAIRRSRSIAQGFLAIDPEPAWEKMRKASKPLFSALGDLRDVQVQMEWVEKLGGSEDPVHQRLLDHFDTREKELKLVAAEALRVFDQKQWQAWAGMLDERAQRIPPGSDVFQLMALERWQEARDLQTAALRNRTKIALHSLRIGLKKFRYIVENFLPEQHDAWSKDLKELQDLLGDIHDLDVLWDTARAIHAFANPQERERWLTIQKQERQQRIDAYRAKMVGSDSLWPQWRGGLPQDEALRTAVQRYFETWAQLRDADLSHAHRVLQTSLTIYDCLIDARVIKVREFSGVSLRDLLTVAAFIHSAHHDKRRKQIIKELRKLSPPPGWTDLHLLVTGLIARYHQGALPSTSHDNYTHLRQSAKNTVNVLAGILRLAESFDADRDGKIPHISATVDRRSLILEAVAYEERTRQAEQISAARHLLESVLKISITVHPPPEALS